MKCIELLPDPLHSARPAEVAQEILKFMLPISPKATKEEKEWQQQLAKLCDNAHKFALLIRGCKDVYRCENVLGDKAVDLAKVEPEDIEWSTGNSTLEDRVAFALFGVLVKYPENIPSTRFVLEKAHVVIYKTSESSEDAS